MLTAVVSAGGWIINALLYGSGILVGVKGPTLP